MSDIEVQNRYNSLSRQLRRMIARKATKSKNPVLVQFLSWEKEMESIQTFKNRMQNISNKKMNMLPPLLETLKISDVNIKEKVEPKKILNKSLKNREMLEKIMKSKNSEKELQSYLEEALFEDELEATLDLFHGMMDIGRTVEEAKEYAFSVWTDEGRSVPKHIMKRIMEESKQYE